MLKMKTIFKEDWWSEKSVKDQAQYIKDHPASDKAKSVKKSQEKQADTRKKLSKKDYEVDAATGKAVKKKEKKKEDPKKKDKHIQAIKKGMFPGSKEYKKFMEEGIGESMNETKYRGYEIKRQNRKDGLPLIIPALQKSASNMKDAKKQIDKFGNKKFMAKNESIKKSKKPSYKFAELHDRLINRRI